MRFRVVAPGETRTTPGVVYLTHTGWDDWFKFSTLYVVEYVDQEGESHRIGTTKIGKFGLRSAGKSAEPSPGTRYPSPPRRFRALGPEFFSLGQDTGFYESLSAIDGKFRDELLTALRDIAYDRDLLAKAEREEVTQESLLRSVPLPTVRDQFSRLAHGGTRLTPYDLSFGLSYTQGDSPPTVSFAVRPDSTPPTNLHVLIGRNGVGKSTFLDALAKHLVLGAEDEVADDVPRIESLSAPNISNVVSVSFSAFDSFDPLPESYDQTEGLTHHYIGLGQRQPDEDASVGVNDPAAFVSAMSDAGRMCLEGARRDRWVKGLRLLETDPIFQSAGVADAIESFDDPEAVLAEIGAAFERLSSGHKIVLLTITKLVETVEEKSIVLLDEPEAHLHPPLLSAFVRALSDLLINRNGMAIVATHSPVVLQEVPRTCAWKIGRVGRFTTVERPLLETFGENVGTLTNEVFGLEVTATGFHRMLWESANAHETYEDALEEFEGQVGNEGRAILRSMVAALGRKSDVAG